MSFLIRMDRHENIIAILDILRPRNIEDFKEVYLIQVSWGGVACLRMKADDSGISSTCYFAGYRN